MAVGIGFILLVVAGVGGVLVLGVGPGGSDSGSVDRPDISFDSREAPGAVIFTAEASRVHDGSEFYAEYHNSRSQIGGQIGPGDSVRVVGGEFSASTELENGEVVRIVYAPSGADGEVVVANHTITNQ